MKSGDVAVLLVLGLGAAWLFFSAPAKAATWRSVPPGVLAVGRYRFTVTGVPKSSMKPKQELARELVAHGWSDVFVYVQGDVLPSDWPANDGFGWVDVYRGQGRVASVGAVQVPSNVAIWEASA
jgi:hypothetical protein